MIIIPHHRRTPAIETVSTQRLVATRMATDDFEDLCCLHCDARVMATLGGVRSDAVTRQFLREKMDHWDVYGFGFYMFRDKVTGDLTGRGGLQNIEVGGAEEVEVGYTVCAEQWGQGYATEMASALLALGFDQLGFDNIVSFTTTTNHASRRVMEKVGFTFERDIIHENRATVLYRLRAEEYTRPR